MQMKTNFKIALVGFGIRGKQWLKTIRKVKQLQFIGIVENDINKIDDCIKILKMVKKSFPHLKTYLNFSVIVLFLPHHQEFISTI